MSVCHRIITRSINRSIHRSINRSFSNQSQSQLQSNREFIAKHSGHRVPQPGDDMHNNPLKNRPINQPTTPESIEQQRLEDAEKARETKYKNLFFGSVLLSFVVWSYQNSISTVRNAADAINKTNLENIEAEIEQEQLYKK